MSISGSYHNYLTNQKKFNKAYKNYAGMKNII